MHAPATPENLAPAPSSAAIPQVRSSRHRVRAIAAAVVALLTLLAGAGTAQAGFDYTTRMYWVIDADGNAVVGATVQFTPLGAGDVVSAVTDDQGLVVVEEVHDGGTGGANYAQLPKGFVYSTAVVPPSGSPLVGYDSSFRAWGAEGGAEDVVIMLRPGFAGVRSLLVYRFWSPVFNNAHFFTTSYAEAEHIATTDDNWVYEGEPFTAFAADGEPCAVGTDAVHRFYSARFQSHFFTINAAEKNAIVAGDRNWEYEGIAYCAATSEQPGTTPLYRFWSPTFGKHHFTTDPGEAQQLDVNDPNWDAEGIAYYVGY